MEILNALKTSILYTVVFILVLMIFSYLLSFTEKKNSSSIFNVFGMKGLVITGVVGTVVHEFSHMLFCVIFRHNITEFSLFRPFKSRYDGIMGYVNHSYDSRSFYQKTGNFFIGIAPIICGTMFLIICMWVMLPSDFKNITEVFNTYMEYIKHINRVSDAFNIYISVVLSLVTALNPFKQSSFLMYMLFLFIMYSVTTHMDLSKEDLRNSKEGFFAFATVIFVLNFVFTLMGFSYQIYILKVYICILSFLTISFIFSLFTMIISKIIEYFATR